MGKVAFITGTSSGFGLLTAVVLAGKGYKVVATMRDLSKREALLHEAARAGVDADALIETVRLDVTDSEEAARVVADAIARYGAIDVLVNNAGFALGGFVEEVPLEDWRQQMETNFFGLIAVTKAVLPSMRERGNGTIVNIGSVSGRIAFPGYAPYAASKFAVEGFSESLRHEMAPFGVRVVLVEPGAYRTAIWGKGIAAIRTSEASPYAGPMKAMMSYSQRAAESAPDPREVAELVGRIADARSPRLRYALGRGSALLLAAKAVLPWSWLEGAIRRALR